MTETVEITFRIYDCGKITPTISGQMDKREDMIRAHPGACMRARYEIIRDDEAEEDRHRSAYFAFIGSFIDHAHEAFTKGLFGDTLTRKTESLHYTLKEEFVKLHPEYGDVRVNFKTGERVSYVFSVARGAKVNGKLLTIAQKRIYYQWAKEMLSAIHLERYGYEVKA